ncbi:DUF5700 domain-containing putative Zn-dependent protease [Chitinophaga solisilvae]|uniref:DUF5700 domain-containing putative Zn-dependent protease n=1 Tax=Chitinophaga solisilvae TaxID=1233460 RepID=UPI00136FDFA5|nr:DUF5700 domain-containing putative Zn-dependent protease [Chitinophaga solisilvae]
MKIILLLSTALLLHLSAVSRQQPAFYNTTGHYWQLADTLQAGRKPSSALWHTWFDDGIGRWLTGTGHIDSVTFVQDMFRIYMPGSDTGTLSESAAYHLEYRKKAAWIKATAPGLEQPAVRTAMKKALYPCLPPRLRQDTLLPTLIYTFMGFSDATSVQQFVIMDMLLACQLHTYAPGLLAAHEAFHSITGRSFHGSRFNATIATPQEQYLLLFLSNVSQEGIADQIDKPVLLQRSSPVYDAWQDLYHDEARQSRQCIRQLDSLLQQAATHTIDISYQDMFNGYAVNGGHIPGRYMCSIIRQSGRWQELLQQADDPLAFMLLYQRAASRKQGKFSTESAAYLQRLQQKLILPVK